MFRSNEYRKGPIEFMMPMCAALLRKDFDLPNILAHSNLKCPILKGNSYHITNVTPDASNFPPLLPEGRWKLQLTFKYQNKYIMSIVNYYAAVIYNIPILPSL
ncbi:hypothetical protein FQR65_LT01667 [Abscondita terminalis]|nr:hypothetical protein FQR65_LT01667 [Abscondita terminalis]